MTTRSTLKHALSTGAVTSILVLTGCTAPVPTQTDKPASSASPEAKQSPSTPDLPDSRVEAEAFRDYVQTNGTPQEKQAIGHVVKVKATTGAVSTATVTTDLEGDMLSPQASTANLIASAFADWKTTESGAGLVTVNSANGELLTNGNY